MDAALEILLSKNKRTLLEYQDKVRYIIEVDPNEIAKGNSNDTQKVNPDNSMNEMVDLSKGMSDEMFNKNADCRLMNAQELRDLHKTIEEVQIEDLIGLDLVDGLMTEKNLRSVEDIANQQQNDRSNQFSLPSETQTADNQNIYTQMNGNMSVDEVLRK